MKIPKTILIINALLIVLLLSLIYQIYMVWQEEYYLAYAATTVIGGLFLCQMMILYKRQKLWSLVRAIVYVLALLVALFFVVSLGDLFTLVGFFKCLTSFLLAFYLIGLRGFLNSKGFLGYMTGVESEE